ncbi:MAG: AsnC family transcriptional regulator, partial [Brevibacterium aurantiacum]
MVRGRHHRYLRNCTNDRQNLSSAPDSATMRTFLAEAVPLSSTTGPRRRAIPSPRRGPRMGRRPTIPPGAHRRLSARVHQGRLNAEVAGKTQTSTVKERPVAFDLDDIDRSIIAALVEDSRLSVRQLAER